MFLKNFDHRSAHNDVYSARIHRYVVFAHYEFEIIDFMFEKKTFLEIREKIIRSQTLQHFSNMLYVWFSILEENQDVIQIHHAKIVY
jgi:SUMO ligase MMS21 Smc5/6 complex component